MSQKATTVHTIGAINGDIFDFSLRKCLRIGGRLRGACGKGNVRFSELVVKVAFFFSGTGLRLDLPFRVISATCSRTIRIFWQLLLIGVAALVVACSSSGGGSSDPRSANAGRIAPISSDYVNWWLAAHPAPPNVLRQAKTHFERIPDRSKIDRNSFTVAFCQGYLDGLIDPDRGDPGIRRGYAAGRQRALRLQPLTDDQQQQELEGFGYRLVTAIPGRYSTLLGDSSFQPDSDPGQKWWVEPLATPQSDEDFRQTGLGFKATGNVSITGLLSPAAATPRQGFARELLARSIQAR